MFRLDRNAHKATNLKTKKKDSEEYLHLTLHDRLKIFAYLQSVAFNYDLSNPPKMDKTIHSVR
jgi:hypothetical protein